MRNKRIGLIVIILVLLVIGVVTSCKYDVEEDGEVYSGEVKFHIMKVDGCQYLETLVDGDRLFTHKGNCNNTCHQQVQEEIDIDTLYYLINNVKNQ